MEPMYIEMYIVDEKAFSNSSVSVVVSVNIEPKES
jgi:hypothetical protein